MCREAWKVRRRECDGQDAFALAEARSCPGAVQLQVGFVLVEGQGVERWLDVLEYIVKWASMIQVNVSS
jgi:hypothetical protein